MFFQDIVKRRPLKRLAAVAVSYFWAAQNANAFWPNDPCDVTYTATGGAGAGPFRRISDGHGRLRIETSGSQGRIVAIEDRSSDKVLFINESSKSAMWGASTPGQGQQELFGKINRKKKLGTSVIAGHKCEGFEESNTTGTINQVNQIWFDVRTGCPVKTKLTIFVDGKLAGELVNTMTSYSSKTPSSSLFKVPAGYRVVGQPPTH